MKLLVKDLQVSVKNKYNWNKVKSLLKGVPFVIAGGAARQLFLDEKFGSTDIDIYPTKDNLGKLLEIARLKASKNKYGNADTFKYKALTIQIIQINTPYNSIEDIFNTFDLHCCCMATDGQYLYFTEEAERDATSKYMRLTGNEKEPDIYRLMKYWMGKGYKIDDEIIRELIYKEMKGFILRHTAYAKDTFSYSKSHLSTYLMEEIKAYKG
jgi:hypothetical protein